MMTNGTYLVWRDAMKTLDGIGRVVGRPSDGDGRRAIPSGSPSARLRRACCRCSVPSPLLGRGFLPGEEDDGRPAIAILSYGLWQRRFGGRSDAVGSALHLDGTSYTIVGVMPASFAFPDHETQAWIPMAIRPVTSRSHPGTSSLSLFQAIGRAGTRRHASAGRHRRHHSRQDAAEHQPGDDGGLRQQRPGGGDGGSAARRADRRRQAGDSPDARRGRVAPRGRNGECREPAARARGSQAPRAGDPIGARCRVGPARASMPDRESAARSARWMRGIWRSRLSLHAVLPSLLPADFPRLEDLAFDARVQLFTMAVALVTGVGFGLLPAIQASRENLVPALTDDALAPVGAACDPIRLGRARRSWRCRSHSRACCSSAPSC